MPDYEPNADDAGPQYFRTDAIFSDAGGDLRYQVKAEAVITGVCETDFSGYPDCRDEFSVKALNRGESGHGERYPFFSETPLNVGLIKLKTRRWPTLAN